MDAGGIRNKGSRFPFSDRTFRCKNSCENLDRFIPNRSAMDFDFAHFMLTGGGRVGKEEPSSPWSPSKEAYRKQLAEIFNMNRTRILAFRNKPPYSEATVSESISSVPHSKRAKHRRCIPQDPEKILDAPELMDDFYLNLLDWGSGNILAIALGNSVYLWDASDGSTTEFVAIDEEIGPVTSIRWAPDGRHLAVGLNNSHVQLWDFLASRKLRTLTEGHSSRVGSLDWNDHILTTGGMDSLIINNDFRIRSHVITTYRAHTQEICGLKWSSTGQQLASGGNDNLIYIWNISNSSSGNSSSNHHWWLHCLDHHRAAVKALSWCPFQSNLLASGGGVGDQCIKYWNAHTGACSNSVDTGSQICCLVWSKHEREILSSHGFNDNQLILWKYPSMVKIAELYGHTSRVLYMSQSPDGYMVASAAADETLRFWNVFGSPQLAKPAPKSNPEPFPNLARIR